MSKKKFNLQKFLNTLPKDTPIQVEWRDHASHGGWKATEKVLEDPLCIVTSVGIFVGDVREKNVLVICTNFDKDIGSRGQYMAILKECILSARVLR